jgi:hypothetical protein
MSILAVIGMGLAATACTAMGPKPLKLAPAPPAAGNPETREIASPTASSAPAKAHCVPRNFPKAPRYPDTDAALRDAGGAADRYQLLAAGRILRIGRLADLEKLVDDCR